MASEYTHNHGDRLETSHTTNLAPRTVMGPPPKPNKPATVMGPPPKPNKPRSHDQPMPDAPSALNQVRAAPASSTTANGLQTMSGVLVAPDSSSIRPIYSAPAHPQPAAVQPTGPATQGRFSAQEFFAAWIGDPMPYSAPSNGRASTHIADIDDVDYPPISEVTRLLYSGPGQQTTTVSLPHLDSKLAKEYPAAEDVQTWLEGDVPFHDRRRIYDDLVRRGYSVQAATDIAFSQLNGASQTQS
ncbi:MAG: hypothetical protein Q9191_006815 [Dirinaria sp. TL-2023a]